MIRLLFLLLFPVIFLQASPDPKEVLNFSRFPEFAIDYSSLQKSGFETSNTLDEIVCFLRDFQREIEKEYGVRPDFLRAIEFAKEITINNSQLQEFEREEMLCFYDLLLQKLTLKNCEAWLFGKNSKELKAPQLELPGKLAAGFMCALGGALLCVIPGGQGPGLTLIGVGLGVAIDGLANGERPYFIDSQTGARI